MLTSGWRGGGVKLTHVLLRVVLCCLAVLVVHSYFVIEQPRQSILFQWFRLQWLQEVVCYESC